MSIGIASLLLNLLIVGLLMATISYCWLLNRRIKILQDSKSELAQLLQYFDESTNKASESIIALQSASKKIGESIQARVEKANFLIDDLNFMIEKGNRIANQLEASFAVSRARNRVMSENPVDETPAVKLQPVVETPEPVLERFVQQKTVEKLSTKEKTAASLEAVLDRVIGRGKPHAKLNDDEEEVVAPRPKPQAKSRSKAEQELLEMIRAGIKG